MSKGKLEKKPGVLLPELSITELGVEALILFGDTHFGCKLGLCPDHKIRLDEGYYYPSILQRKVWKWWQEFWRVWVPLVTRGMPFAAVHVGDVIEGVHHGVTTTISNNIADQVGLAEEVLAPVVEMCGGMYLQLRGTEAHGGKSGTEEERLAKTLGAIPNEYGQYSRYELRCEIGKCLVHVMHHIGTTSSLAYETTAPMKELQGAFSEAGQWNERSPNIIVRAHRHRHSEVKVVMEGGYGIIFVLPGWQLKTPFSYKMPGARLAQPQFGGSLIMQGDEEWYTRHKVWKLDRPKIVKFRKGKKDD